MVNKGYLSIEKKKLIMKMTHEGYSSRYIANIIECHQSTIVRNINRINERQKSLLPLPKTGGKRISTETDDRRLMRIYKSNKRMTARDLQAEWHLDACSQTIRNRLKEHGIKNYSTTKKPQLSSKNIQQRLEFCKKYESWKVEDWKTVVFSDETNIQAEPNGGHRKVWRKPTERLPDFVVNTARKFPTSIMIWGCISAHGMGEFHILEGRLNASGYISILEDKLRPYTTRLFPDGNFSFQQDNAPCHTARPVSYFK